MSSRESIIGDNLVSKRIVAENTKILIADSQSQATIEITLPKSDVDLLLDEKDYQNLDALLGLFLVNILYVHSHINITINNGLQPSESYRLIFMKNEEAFHLLSQMLREER